MRLGPGDLVEVSVYGVPDLTTRGRVNSEGMISLPLAGSVKVSEMRVEDAERAIEAKLMDGGFLKAPHVAIFVTESITETVNILGEVSKPGGYPVLGKRTLFDAISMAGGLTPRAGGAVTISHRDHPNDPVVVRLHPAGSSTDLASDLSAEISGGDTVSVSQAGIIYVVGAVARPSGFLMDGGGKTTVLKALALAGGALNTAALSRARILRKGPDGKSTEQSIPLKKMLYAKAEDITMEAEDVLFIPDSAAKAALHRASDAAIQTASTLGVLILR